MQITRILKSIGPIDARSVRRDPLLSWMVLLPIITALVARWGVPPITEALQENLGFDLSLYYPVMASYLFVMLIPLMFGVVIGFLLLDERDDDTLTALQVTPMPLTGYLAYRIAVPMALSVVMTLVAFPIAGLSDLHLGAVALVALAAAPLAPLFALFLAAFAANKVQGFALLKGLGAVLIVPTIAFFIPSAWQLLFGVFPTYWPVKAYWQLEAGQGDFWIYLLIGLLYQGAFLVLLVRRFNTVLHR